MNKDHRDRLCHDKNRSIDRRLEAVRTISIRRDVADAILDYNSENPEAADSARKFLTKCGRLGMDVFDVDKRLRGEAPTRMKSGHATVDVPEKDFMKIYASSGGFDCSAAWKTSTRR